jgi:O-acetyl-ADP-ribose deacetylase
VPQVRGAVALTWGNGGAELIYPRGFVPAMNEILRLDLGEGSSIQLLVGDITHQDTDALVNAANSSLMGGGGVDGAIHRAGGPAILDECKKIVAEHGPLPTGQAVATTGGKLRAGYVIHTVGPVWRGGDANEAATLASCYRESLLLADKMRLHNIAFPAISTGIFGYPIDQASKVSLEAVTESLRSTKVTREARFVLFDQPSFSAFAQAANHLAANCSGRVPIRIDRVPSQP